jgi:GcrA cell cycle regulator
MLRRFRELHRQKDASFTAIANTMSEEFKIELTRNACIGKAHRLDLPRRFKPHIVRKVKVVREKVIRMKIYQPPPPPPSPPRKPEPFTLTITELEHGDCKWPSGGPYDRPPFLFCGKAALAGLPYCKAHTAKSRGKQTA